MIFNYTGNLSFKVKIFSRSGCERWNFCKKTHKKREKFVPESSLATNKNSPKPHLGETDSASEVSCVIISDDEDEEENNGCGPILIFNSDCVQSDDKFPEKSGLRCTEGNDEKFPENTIVAKNGNNHEDVILEAPGLFKIVSFKIPICLHDFFI